MAAGKTPIPGGTFRATLATILGGAIFADYDAANATTNGSGRFRLFDSVGGRHLDSPDAGSDPDTVSETTLNNRAAVRFNASGEKLICIAAASDFEFLHDGSRHCLWVVSSPTGSGTRMMLSNANSFTTQRGATVYHTSTEIHCQQFRAGAASTAIVTAGAYGSLIQAVRDESQSPDQLVTYYRSGQAPTTGSSTFPTNAGAPPYALTVGVEANSASSNQYSGTIARIVIARGAALTDQMIANATATLRNLYGLNQ